MLGIHCRWWPQSGLLAAFSVGHCIDSSPMSKHTLPVIICCFQERYLQYAVGSTSGRRTGVKLLQGCPLSHERLFFRFTPPQPGDLQPDWKVTLIEVLFDMEALEGLWQKLQPGSTSRLKSQVSLPAGCQ